MSTTTLTPIDTSTALAQFKTALQGAGIEVPEHLNADGKLYRCNTIGQNGKRGKDAAAYMLHLDGLPAGGYQNWQNGAGWQNWRADIGRAYSPEENQAIKARMDADHKAGQAETKQRQDEARERARLLLADSWPVQTHPYLEHKGVQAHGVKIGKNNVLLIPMRDAGGQLHSLQTIAADGAKRFLSGGRKKGCFYLIGELPAPDGLLCIVEGFATGASIYEATGYAVAVAFDAGNLLPVAESLRELHPKMRLCICADDDYQTDGNTGLTKGSEAAKKLGAVLAAPEFGQDRSNDATDFNDLHQAQGLEAVALCIDKALNGQHTTPENSANASHVVIVTGAGQDHWPTPTPLPSTLPAVAPFDADLLPESLQAWVMDIAQRMNCPPDFVAVAAVVSLSSLIGARCTVRPKRKDDWRLVPNLWGAVIGRPGVKKSPALNEAMQPLHMAETLDRERWQEDYTAWQIDAQVAEMAADANKKLASKEAAKNPAKAREFLSKSLDIGQEPQRRRFVVQDFSIEKLHEIISQEVNGLGLLVFRDELHGLLTSLDRQGQEGARGFLLTAYDGNQGYGMERIGRGSVYAERVCLSLLGGIQPAKLQSYVRDACSNGAGDDGLLQRFSLAVWPDIEPSYQHIDCHPDHEAEGVPNFV